MKAVWRGSPNFSNGRSGFRPEAIVIHIMQGTMADTDSWFATPRSAVSAHYGVSRAGEIHQYVAEGDTAWHAGRVNEPTWPLIKAGVNPNLYTIGIEHEGHTGDPWTDALVATSASLVAEIANHWGIPIDSDHVTSHASIFSPKSFCPGRGVELPRLIAMARGAAPIAGPDDFVAAPIAVTARSNLNLRRGAPSTHGDIVRVVAANTTLNATGWTSSGESVNGNSHWYRDRDGNFFWAGATDRPLPGA
jgi:N-acetylmuramoyl-L-alanine amidase